MTGASIAAAGHPKVCEAAGDVLKAGGNAFDAVVAAGFAAGIAEPTLSSLGGGGFLLGHTADGRDLLYDFFVDTPGLGLAVESLEPHFVPVTVHFPGLDQVFVVGLGSAAVPGILKGLLHVHDQLGRLDLEHVVAPAIRMARHGVELNPYQAYLIDILFPILSSHESGRLLYSPNGRQWKEGDMFVNPAMGDFLDAIAAGDTDSMYTGSIAGAIGEDMREGQGLLTTADLAAYRVIEREPLTLNYRDHQLTTNPPPSFGGSLVTLSLRLLEREDLPSMEWGSPDHLGLLAAALIEINELRVNHADQLFDLNPTELGAASGRIRRAFRGTTHSSVCDAEGNAAGLSMSNGQGCGYLAPGTGVMLNNMLGEEDLHPQGFHSGSPGERVGSMLSPSIISRDGEVQLVLGSGGSKRIRTAILQVIINMFDFGMSVTEAVNAPRMHWEEDQLHMEPGFPPASVDSLAKKWPVKVWDEQNLYFGGVHAVAPPRAEGAGDPRRGGHAEVIS